MSIMRAAPALALLLGVAACAPLPLAFRQGAGVQTIDHGQRFGVSIGMSRSAARVAMLKLPASHFINSEKCRDYPASHEMCNGATDTDLYRIDGIFGTGIVGLQVLDDHIVRITWSMEHYELV